MNDSVVERISTILQSQKVTKKKLLEDLNLAHNSFNKWTSGQEPRASVLLQIAQYLGVSVEYLLTGEQKGNTQEQNKLLSDFATLKPEYQDIILKNIQMFKELN